MIHKPILATLLALALFSTPGALASEDAQQESCAPGGDLPVVFWNVRIYSGTCVGVELDDVDPSPFYCPGPDVLPCGFKLVVYL